MFKWNVEEMRLMKNESILYYKGIGRDETPIFKDESLSREEKIKAIDNLHDGGMTYILNLINHFLLIYNLYICRA